MKLLRSRCSTVSAAVALGLLVLGPAPAAAQMFVELGGGWNYVAAQDPVLSWTGGSSIRASIGWHVEPRVRLRIDALRSEYDAEKVIALPCPSFGCSGPGYSFQSERVSAITANALWDADQRGILYVIGGAGLYGVKTQGTEWVPGVSAGAGVAIPVVSRLRAVVEARWHLLLGSTAGPPWLVPITIGLRY